MTKASRSRLSWIILAVSAASLAPAAGRAQTAPPAEPPPPAAVTEPPPTPPPPTVSTASKGSITFKGFLSATLFAQDAPFFFGDGHNAQLPLPTRDKGDDPWFFDGDVRNTRLNLTWDGPTGTALPKLGAVLEVDFFGGTPGGGFGNAQPVPRLRVATAQIGIGNMTLKIGQDWSPWFGNVPTSLAHMAFPLGYGSAGTSGWRFPGIFLIVPLTPKDAALGLRLTLAVLRNSWPAAPALNPPNAGSGGIPQLEARLDVTTKMVSAYVVGHYDSKDLPAGRGDPDNADTLSSFGVEVGVKLTSGPLLLQANGWYAKAMGHQFANLTQFGDIAGFGVWGQVGYDVTPNIGVFAFFGIDDPDDEDVRAAIPVAADTAAASLPRLRNLQAAAMVRYKVGPYQLGLEYLWDQLDFNDIMGDDDVAASQVALSANYAF